MAERMSLRFGGKAGGRLAGKAEPRAAEPDAELIRTLAGLLSETGLTEIEYAVGDTRIRVARGAAGMVPQPAPINGKPHYQSAPEPAPAVSETSPADHPGTLKSPIVGVVYLAPEPGTAPFVHVGDEVSEGQTMLIIEAMKVMNQIRAPRAGRLARVFVEDAAPVEYGAPLMLIE